MHYKATSPFADETRRHPNVIQVQMRDHESVDSGFFKSELGETVADRISTVFPICPTVDHQQSTIRLDHIGVDPGRRPEGQRGGDEMDPVSQRLRWRNVHLEGPSSQQRGDVEKTYKKGSKDHHVVGYEKRD